MKNNEFRHFICFLVTSKTTSVGNLLGFIVDNALVDLDFATSAFQCIVHKTLPVNIK